MGAIGTRLSLRPLQERGRNEEQGSGKSCRENAKLHPHHKLSSPVLGLINGLIVVFTGIPSFIATLGTLLAYRGLVRALGGGQATGYTPETKPLLFAVLNDYITPLNQLFDPAGNFRVSSLWFIGLVIVASFVLMRTRHGNWTFAVGGNLGAALAQGVNVKRIKLINFVLSGFLAGLAGVVLFAQRSSMNELIGQGLELTVVAAAVIGGVSLNGGTGTIVGAAVGMLILSMLEQGLVLVGVTNELFQGWSSCRHCSEFRPGSGY